VKLPEAFVHAVDRDAGRASPRLLVRDGAFEDDERAGPREPARGETRVALDVFGQRLAEEPGGRDDVVGAAEAAEEDVTQGGAHRVADEERAGEHGRGGGNAQDDREVRAPEESEVASEERGGCHWRGRSRCSTSS
jgi:hypothetical protein